MPEFYPDLTGKKILVLATHSTIGQAMKLNLEYILHLTVQECTLNRDSSQNIPAKLLSYEPDLILIAEPADICNINDMFRTTPWLQRYESSPFLILCVQPETHSFDSENIHYLQFPYEQEELHAKLSDILCRNSSELTAYDENKATQTSILIVEDEWIVATDLQKILEKYPYTVCGIYTNGEDAIAAAIKKKPEVILIDKHLPGLMDGSATAHQIQTDLGIPVIFITSFADQTTFKTTDFPCPISHILKPFDDREVHTAVEIALYKHQVELDLRQRTEELQERNAELDAFTWAVTHEIRDPINISRDFAEMLVDYDAPFSDREIRHSLGIIHELTANVQETIDNLTLLATLRDTTVAFKAVNMTEIVTRAEQRLEELKRRYNADIVQLGQLPDVIGHSPWIEEIWVKFISTAIRFGGTPPKLTIGATKHKDEVRFWVRDNGPGIKEEEKKYLFSPYPSTELTHHYNTSLGLTVVERIASRLGSRLSVESNPGHGNTFAFTLPIRRHDHVSMRS